MLLSSTYCAPWSAPITGSSYSRIKLENADSDEVRHCTSVWYAMVLPAKLNASISTDLWPAIFGQWYASEQSSLQKFFSRHVLCGVCQVLTGWLLFMYLWDIKLLIICKSMRRHNLPFGFLCAKIGLAYLVNVIMVIMPYLCSKSNATVISSLNMIGVGRLWL